MISKEYAFHAPRGLDEALTLLARHGDDAKLLGGGMSLVPMMTLGLVEPEVVISLNHLRGLDHVTDDGRVVRIGGLVRHETVRTHAAVRESFPCLAEAAAFIGDVQVRHRGTIGGSLAHADPAADYLPVMHVLGARIRVRSAAGERVLEARDFFVGLMQTALRPDEILTEVELPKPPAGTGTSYQRLHRIEGNFAIVGAAAAVGPGRRSGRVALGGLGPRTLTIELGDRLALGAGEDVLEAIAEEAFAASADAFADLHGDVEYRRAMARVYAKRVVRTAAERAR